MRIDTYGISGTTLKAHACQLSSKSHSYKKNNKNNNNKLSCMYICYESVCVVYFIYYFFFFALSIYSVYIHSIWQLLLWNKFLIMAKRFHIIFSGSPHTHTYNNCLLLSYTPASSFDTCCAHSMSLQHSCTVRVFPHSFHIWHHIPLFIHTCMCRYIHISIYYFTNTWPTWLLSFNWHKW